MHCARAASEDGQDVANGRAIKRSYDADAARKERKRLLEFFVEQAFRREAVAHLLESDAQRARANGIERLDYQLVLAARLIHRQSPTHANLQTVRRAKADAPVDA